MYFLWKKQCSLLISFNSFCYKKGDIFILDAAAKFHLIEKTSSFYRAANSPRRICNPGIFWLVIRTKRQVYS